MTGSLQEKNNKFYVVLNFKVEGKRKQKWIPSGLDVKGNKRKALEFLKLTLQEYEKNEEKLVGSSKMLFADFMLEWLEVIKTTVRPNTYCSYVTVVKAHIEPYFRKEKLNLQDLKPIHIQKYYSYKLETISGNTVIKHHANIHKALAYAVTLELIQHNPADNVLLPKKKKFKSSYYDVEQINKLLQIVRGTTLEIPVLLTSYYGFRRSEILGLKWSAIDFKQNVIHVDHTAILVGSQTVYDDVTKTKSSCRTLPLDKNIKSYLQKLKKKQLEDKILMGNCYQDNDYVCKRQDGSLIKPNYISQAFKDILVENNMPPIRFHDLRHSSASMLLNLGYSIKDIQEWLGHGDYATTANIYAHLQYESKVNMASEIEGKLAIY